MAGIRARIRGGGKRREAKSRADKRASQAPHKPRVDGKRREKPLPRTIEQLGL